MVDVDDVLLSHAPCTSRKRENQVLKRASSLMSRSPDRVFARSSQKTMYLLGTYGFGTNFANLRKKSESFFSPFRKGLQ